LEDVTDDQRETFDAD